MKALFVKKPTLVEAEQWIGSNISTLSKFMNTGKTDFCTQEYSKGIIKILTIKNIIVVKIGDWIIKGDEGELTSCTNREFWNLYKLASEYEDYYDQQSM